MLTRVNILIFWILIGIFGTISIYLGKDVNWDLRNYHFYNAYSFLNQRINYDYLPAQVQTFNNPLLDLIIYQLINYLPAKIAGFIIGGIQGINCFIVLLIVQSIIPQSYSSKLKLFMSLLITIFGAYSPMFISEIGTTFGDNLTSLLVLIGFLLVISNQRYKYILAGFLIGCAVGLKLTNLVYALAILITNIIVKKPFYQKLSTTISTGIGIIIGILISGGYWMWIMWEKYQNPLFPYYNSIFKSPYFSLINFRDERFIPKNIIQAIYYPFAWAIAEHPSLELAFRDLRWLIISLLFLIMIFNYKSLFSADSDHSNFQIEQNSNLESNRYIILFTFLSFFIWLFQFGYQRYLITLELISGLAIFCLLEQIIKGKWIKIQLFIFLTILIIVTTLSPSWGRVTWNQSWLEVTVPKIEVPEQTLVLIVSREPISYVIPFFPKQIQFLRIDGNFVKFIKNTILEKQITDIIQKHQGRFLLLSPKDDHTNYGDTLNTYDLKISENPCLFIKSQFEQLKLCPVNRELHKINKNWLKQD